ncbi:MAG TPA: Mu transposase C-terminal domain-containing protein [Blastocatellia bacterium]|nr:Mu transposase C-terminal domain-containing protein [Blastocatellia bacterium]
MLNQTQWLDWIQQLKLPPATVKLITQIRTAAPARRVQSRRGNVSGAYPSRKMGVTLQFESHRQELAAIYELEHDASVLEFYDQPPAIKLNYLSGTERSVGVFHTPDFFVLRADAAGYEECKPEQELIRLAEQSPQRYQRTETGVWHCPPGESAAAPYGLYYRLRSSAGIDWVWQRNIQFLEDYLRTDQPPVEAVVQTQLTALVTQHGGLRLSELFHQSAAWASRDTVYALLATQGLYVDLREASLTRPEQVRVYAHGEAARAVQHCHVTSTPEKPAATVTLAVGQRVLWDDIVWEILNVGTATLALRNDAQQCIEMSRTQFEEWVRHGRLQGMMESAAPSAPNAALLARLTTATESALRVANQRAEHLSADRRGESVAVPARTLRRWRAGQRAAEQSYGCGYVGLVPHTAQRGNRGAKVPEDARQFMTAFIAREYETLKQPSRLAVYAKLLQSGATEGVPVPSYKTFCRAIAQRDTAQQTRQRQGPRAAYQQEAFYWELALTTPRHGDRPWEICHLDHTQADLELRCSETGLNLGRPWLTLLTDAYSRRILAFWLTFDPPSYRSCMMALRECVRRHGRLPQILVVDGGVEFASVYFETLLARYECLRKTRPAAQPRFGSVCERIFGTATTQFFHNLAGNTQLTQCVRQVTQAVAPRTQAVWTLGALADHLQAWAYEIYDTTPHPALGQSPRAAFVQGLQNTGTRPQRLIPYDEEFLLWTRPTTSKGTAKVLPGRGVRIHNLLYWCEAFRHPRIEGTRVAVRYDPYDAGRAWAACDSTGRPHWCECHSEYYSVLRGRSEKELLLATQELRARRRQPTQRFSVQAKQLAVFLQSAEAEEALLKQRLRDLATRRLLTAVDTASSADSATVEVLRQADTSPPHAVEPAPEVRELYEEF